MQKKLLYFNALFDLELGAHRTDSVQRSAAEMTTLFAPMGESADRILLDVRVDDNYWEHLRQHGITTPTPFYSGDCTGYTGSAWGWNEHSIARLSKTGVLCSAPDPKVVQIINSRQFCSELGVLYGFGIPRSRFCISKEQFLSACSALKDNFPIVIKPAFGSSGSGFVYIPDPDDFEKLSTSFFTSSSGAVVEPWCNKLHDLSSVCVISRNGDISAFRHQRSHTNIRGTFYGVYFTDNDPVIKQWENELETASQIAACEIVKLGYFGPVGFDSIVYETNGKVKLAPIIEINARHVMSDIGSAIRTSCKSARHSFFRLLNRKRFRLPKSYPELRKFLSGIEFRNGQGVLVISPLQIQHGEEFAQPLKNFVFIASESEQELWNIDEELRSRTACH